MRSHECCEDIVGEKSIRMRTAANLAVSTVRIVAEMLRFMTVVIMSIKNEEDTQ